MAAIIQLRRDTALNWVTADPILANGEMGYETDSRRMKVGNGTDIWTNLDYLQVDAVSIWGNITGTLSDQTDLQNELDLKTDLSTFNTHANDTNVHYPQSAIVITESQISDLQAYLTDIQSESIKDLSDVLTTMLPNDGDVFTYNTTTGWNSVAPGISITDHGDLTSIGTNTHAQIDIHLANKSDHFPITSIDHNSIKNIGTKTHATIDGHINDTTIHYPQSAISITESQISDFGTYEPAFTKNTAFNKNFGNVADTVAEGNDPRLIAGGTGIQPGDNVSLLVNDAGYLTNINNESIYELSDVDEVAPTLQGQVLAFNTATNMFEPSSPLTSHLVLTDIGVNTHDQIDTHITDTNAHIADGAIHFTEGTIDHNNITNIGTNNHNQIDSHIADGAIHLGNSNIQHDLLLGVVGTNNTHSEIDSHIDYRPEIHFEEKQITHNNILDNGGFNSHAHINTHMGTQLIHNNWVSGNSFSDFVVAPSAGATASIAIGEGALVQTTSDNGIAIGSSVVNHSADFGIAIGTGSSVATITAKAIAIGFDVVADVDFGTKIGVGTKDTTKSLLNLETQGVLKLEGDRAQYVHPNYETIDLPIGILGATVWDATVGALRVFDGTDWVGASDGVTDHDLLINNGGAGSHDAISVHMADTNNPHSSTVSNLNDTIITTPATNDILSWDGTQWVNQAPTSLGTFLSLSDTPADYTGNEGNTVHVNSAGDGLEFVADQSTGTTSAIYRFNTAVAGGDPGIGKCAMDNADPTLVTKLYISSTDDNGISTSGGLSVLNTSDFVSYNDRNTANFFNFEIQAPGTNNGTWFTFDVVYQNSLGGFINNERLDVEILLIPAKSWINLLDTPNSYASQSGKYVRVKTTEDGLQFDDVDHLNLLNIGVNTHDQIDTHITDTNAHIADGAIHFTEGTIDHVNILNIGVNTHIQIDQHIVDTNAHFADSTIHFDVLDGLSDVIITTPIADDVLGYDGVDWVNGQLVIADLGDINDVTLTTPADGQVLTYQAGIWVNLPAGGSNGSLNDLSDVTITTPVAGNGLVYNGTVFENKQIVQTDITEAGTSQVTNMVSLTQADYDVLTPVPTTFYIIVG